MALKSKELTPKVKRVVVDLTIQGLSGKHIDELLNIKPRTVENFLKRYREHGFIENVPRNGSKKDAHAGIPGPYCVMFGETADQL